MDFVFLIYFCFLIKTLRAFITQQPLLSPPTLDPSKLPSISNAIKNAPHIFNTINGAMRQWGPSLKHNGMSFFPVTIAENTTFYHGDVNNATLSEIEWLAFEIEHAEYFTGKVPLLNKTIQQPYPNIAQEEEKLVVGYFRNYRTTRTLRNLLYLDGQSAAKSTLGTLDTQDNVLLKDVNFKGDPGFQDLNRVSSICKLMPHLEGIVRMELGFELILCNTSQSIQLISMVSRVGKWQHKDGEDAFFSGEFMRGVSLGYSGVGAGKVLIDYSSMVSAYFYPLNLTNPIAERARLPRIPTDDVEGIERLREDVLAIFDGSQRAQGKIDWQAITDSIVRRYSDRLAYMKNNKSNRTEMLFELNILLERFIDHSTQNLTVAQELCTAEYLLPVGPRPTSLTEEMIYEAFIVVSGKICSVLLKAREKLMERDDSDVASEVKQLIDGLMKWLDWSTWLECGKCDWNEVCVVAIWPWGSKEDHEHPRCYEITEAWGGTGYWDFDLGFY